MKKTSADADAMARQTAEEAALLRAARSDLNHFAPIYERYFPRIYGYCLRRVGDAQEAEDLTSVVFTNAMTGLGQFRGGVVAAWLFQIAHHAVVNHLKVRGRKQRMAVALDELPADIPHGAPLPDEEVITREQVDRLHHLVAALPAEQQDMLLLRLVGGLSAEEIGVVLRKRAGTIRVALHRVIRHLQHSYRELEAHHD